jgi:hypothetical protein
MIPDNLVNSYSMNGDVDIQTSYISYGGENRQHYIYSEELVNNFIARAQNKNSFHYHETDQWLYQALDKYPIMDKNILIIGSEEPCYEGISIYYGASVTMVEYQFVTSTHPKLKTLTVEEFKFDPNLYDGAISISSIEHSGLGRYGDELDPDGDLKAMEILYNKLNKGSLCFLAVPVGKDQILWNAHRVYGRKRLPLLIKGFELIDSFGLIDEDLDVDEHNRRQQGRIAHREGVSVGAHQPILVLKKI